MSDTLLYILLSVLGGIAIGFLVGMAIFRRPDTGAADANELIANELRARLEDQQREASRIGQALLISERSRSAAEARVEEMRRSHQDQITSLRQEQERQLTQMRESFEALSADALAKMQPQFLGMAKEVLAKQALEAKGDLSQRQEAIASLLKPLEQTLKTYQDRLAQSETSQAGALGEVRKQLEQLAQQSSSLSGETSRLRMVLSSNQARGRWGEETLRNVVEASGMSQHCDFSVQVQEGDKKPDLVVKLPGDRMIIVDSKVPDLDFLNALNASDDMKRKEALELHANKLRGTIRDLASRNYPKQFPNSLDHVVLFLPAESLFSAALEGDRDLIVWAAREHQIMLATPASLIALLRSVAVSWQQHDQAENAREIAEAASELYSRTATFIGHFENIRVGLVKANDAFNSAVGSYERSVRPQGERMVKLGAVNTAKQLVDVTPIPDALRIAPAAKTGD